MPSPRKRIGYLPSQGIQEIIDKICLEVNLSQSKVTGMLVEEALIARGILEQNIKLKNIITTGKKVPYFNLNQQNNNFKSNSLKLADEYDLEEELILLKDFVEFKQFKRLLDYQNNFKEE